MALLGPQAKLHREMEWQMDMVDRDSLHDQLQSATRNRAIVPMEELEARASRFVSHLVGDTENVQPQSNSSKVPPSLSLMVRLDWLNRVAAEEELFRQLEEAPSVPLNDRMNR
jgi:hypothetical protein